MREVFHKKVTFKLADLTALFVLSIVSFSLLAHALTLWLRVYECHQPLALIDDINPGVALVHLEYEDSRLKGLVEGNAVRFLYDDRSIVPDDSGAFEVFIK